MMMNAQNDVKLQGVRSVWSRPEVVFIVAAIVLLASFLIPLPSKALDIVWVCVFCLAGAVTLICTAAKSSADLMGFVPLISFLTLLRLMLQGVIARKILQDQYTGMLMSRAGGLLTDNLALGAILVCLILAAIVVVIIFAACQKITSCANNYLLQIFPLKRIGIETDLRMGVIDETGAKALAKRIITEYRFFSGMNGTSLLMRGEAAICIFILLACLIMPIVQGTVQVSGAEFIAKMAPPVVTLALFTLVPAVIVAAACGALMGKDTLTLRAEGDGAIPHPSKKIKIVARDTGTEEEIELLNPDFAIHSGGENALVENPVFSAQEHVSKEDVEDLLSQAQAPKDELPMAGKVKAGPLAMPVEIPCRDAAEYYEKLSRMICMVESAPRVVLLAAEKVNSLPVTVAVNIAIQLAQKKQKVLLVDTDTARHAMAQVFEMDPATMLKKVQSSCFENLSVCSVPAAKLDKLLSKKKILEHFGTTLIYTPNAPDLHFKAKDAAAVPNAFYFTDKSDFAFKMTASEIFACCESLRLVPDLQSVLK
jgi:hypothetical protein